MLPASARPPRSAARRSSRAPSSPPAAANAVGSIVPFDHAAQFELTGRPGNLVQDVINVSADGVFVAVAIGYGLEEDRGRPLPVPSIPVGGLARPGDITLGQLESAALIEGFRVDPSLNRLVFVEEDLVAATARGVGVEPRLIDQLVAQPFFNGPDRRLVLERRRALQEFSFLLSVVDSSSGRELQDEPIHNLASLGKSNGERPFRLLARPAVFLPRSTVRLQVTERTDGLRGTLFVVFYGYRVLAPGCSEARVRELLNATHRSAVPPARRSRAVPFDYVTTFRLTGAPGNIVEDEISINAESGFVATALGYGLEVETIDSAITLPPPVQTNFNLANVALRQLPTSALQDGIRIRPDLIRLCFNGSALANRVPSVIAGEIFERLNVPEAVSFRYSIFDSGRGIELQNQPIHNIAGLGAADGSRPFRKLFRPLVCLPRSTIRVRVQEHLGRGTLFIVFQGLKRLETTAGERS